MVAHDIRRFDPPLRLTRRGRAVVLVLLALVASLASAVLFTTASRADDQPATAPPTIAVEQGDTLWDIAARVQPGRNGRDAVDDLRRLNHLSDSTLTPGQTLILPRS
jgi:Tfp pilus assembly protein FimV